MQDLLLKLCYLIGSVTFIVGLKMLSHPDTAKKGNLVAAFGMTIAIIGTLFLYYSGDLSDKTINLVWIFAALIIGTIVGTIAAKKVQMTAMPQMVSLFNGMGGACAAIISIVEFKHLMHEGLTDLNNLTALTILAGLVIGTVSFFGSMIAFGKDR